MIVLDVNVLLAAHRLDHPQHTVVRPWWDALLTQGASFVVSDVCWIGFLRIVTSTRIFTVPTPMPDALAFVRATRAQPGYASPLSREAFEEFIRVCASDQVRGNLVTDAWIAATALCIGAKVATFDRDFRRFVGLSTIEPALDAG